MLNKQHTLFVCTTCASVWQNGKRVGESKGEQLLQQLQQLCDLNDIFAKRSRNASKLIRTRYTSYFNCEL
jgi:predicted metal-binding protein